jgi:hypothetical protein
MVFTNTGGNAFVGREGSTGTNLGSVSLPYALALVTETAYPIEFVTNNVTRIVIDSSGNTAVSTGKYITFNGNSANAEYAIQGAASAAPYDFRFIGSSDAGTNRNFSFGYYTSDSSSSTWNPKVTINSYTGNVGIGTITPSYKLHVVGDIYSSGTITEASSITLKENLNPITDALDVISSLQGWIYDRKDGTAMKQAGFIAEEVEQVLPNVVSKTEDGTPMGVQYTKIIAYLVESVKELKAQIEVLRK